MLQFCQNIFKILLNHYFDYLITLQPHQRWKGNSLRRGRHFVLKKKEKKKIFRTHLGGFGCLELCLYGISELVYQHYNLNQSERSISADPTNEKTRLPVYDEAVGLDEDIVLQRLLHTQQVAVDGLGLEDRKYFDENILLK